LPGGTPFAHRFDDLGTLPADIVQRRAFCPKGLNIGLRLKVGVCLALGNRPVLAFGASSN